MGEAGIGEWLDAVIRSFPHWRIYVSDRMVDSEYGVDPILESLRGREHVEFKSELHLATSVRSFRSEKVSRLGKELLDLELDTARGTRRQVQGRYPIALTRDLNTAWSWLHGSIRGKAWQHIREPERQKYLKNAYRVLLTRARQGMVLVVPRGDDEDPTRNPTYYDETFDYLRRCGMQVI